ncbi:hypothetical protein [Nonomuraea helvata]|uniref:hypothetical protein n=1 Tax=Nonomuraea helvata TaxID=37484 RepID=UPI0031EA1D11
MNSTGGDIVVDHAHGALTMPKRRCRPHKARTQRLPATCRNATHRAINDAFDRVIGNKLRRNRERISE